MLEIREQLFLKCFPKKLVGNITVTIRFDAW